MPCDTPPPPSHVDDINEDNDGDLDDSMYDFADDIEIIEVDSSMVEEENDDALVTFDGHKESVFCCNFDNSGQYAVTGGQDDTAFVWNVQDKSIKFECKGHSESVIAASFSPDSKYVATADMNGLVKVWNFEDGTVAWDFESSEITWMTWLKRSNILIAGSRDGTCWKWSIPDGDTSVFASPAVYCSMGDIAHNDEKLVTGYSDGSLKLWNVSDNRLLGTLSGSAGHKEAITTIKYNEDDSLILTGSEDGTVKVIKASDFKVLWDLDICDNNQHTHEAKSVEDVGFIHSLPYIVVGSTCGFLSIWDMSTKTRRAHAELFSYVVKIICDKVEPVVYVAVGNGVIQAHDARTGEAIKDWHGHKAAILDLAVSSDNKLFLTASDDHTCKIFQRSEI